MGVFGAARERERESRARDVYDHASRYVFTETSRISMSWVDVKCASVVYY